MGDTECASSLQVRFRFDYIDSIRCRTHPNKGWEYGCMWLSMLVITNVLTALTCFVSDVGVESLCNTKNGCSRRIDNYVLAPEKPLSIAVGVDSLHTGDN